MESVATSFWGVLPWKLSPVYVFDYLSVVGMEVRLTVACVPPPSRGRHGTLMLSPQTSVVVVWQRATFGF